MMRMRKGSLVMVSELSHLTNLRNFHVGITDCRKLKSMCLEYGPVAQHLYHHENPSSRSLDITCVLVNITGEAFPLGQVGEG